MAKTERPTIEDLVDAHNVETANRAVEMVISLLGRIRSADARILVDTDAKGVRTVKGTVTVTDKEDITRLYTSSLSDGLDGWHYKAGGKRLPSEEQTEKEPKAPEKD